jgi:hypothetical protein
MSTSDEQSPLMQNMNPACVTWLCKISDELADHIYFATTNSERKKWTRKLQEFTVGVYILDTGSFETTRLEYLLASLAAKALGHTRTD